MTRPPPTGGDRSDIVVATAVAAAIYALLLAVAAFHRGGDHFALALLSGTAGAALGWVIGIGLSPYGKGEREDFASIGKLVAGFLGGWGISKVDTALRSLAGGGANGLSLGAIELAAVLATIGLTSMLTAAALTYVTRRYWVTPGQDT